MERRSPATLHRWRSEPISLSTSSLAWLGPFFFWSTALLSSSTAWRHSSGPLFVPLLMSRTFRGKFYNFVDVLLSFAMIRAVASAFIFVWSGFLITFLQQTFNGGLLASDVDCQLLRSHRRVHCLRPQHGDGSNHHADFIWAAALVLLAGSCKSRKRSWCERP